VPTLLSDQNVRIRLPEELSIELMPEERPRHNLSGKSFHIREPGAWKVRLSTEHSLVYRHQLDRSSRQPGRSATRSKGPPCSYYACKKLVNNVHAM